MNKKLIGLVVLAIILYFLMKMWKNVSNGSGEQLEIDNESDVSTGGGLEEDVVISGEDSGIANNGATGGSTSLPFDQNCGLGGAPNGNGVCGSVPRLANTTNPNNAPTLYEDDNIINPVLPMSSGTLSIGVCNNALNNNSNYISTLTGSPMTPTSILQFLDNMRTGYANGEANPNSSGCNFLKRRQFSNHSDLSETIASSSYISAPNDRAQKQAKLDFLTATINNCCGSNTTPEISDASGFTAVYANSNNPITSNNNTLNAPCITQTKDEAY